MSNFQVHKTSLRTLKKSDNGFQLKDGLITAPRAGIEISNRCPANYKELILECMRHGWLTPIATVYDHELTFAALKDDYV